MNYCQSDEIDRSSILEGELTVLTTSGIWENAACCAICCCIAIRVDSSIWGCEICAEGAWRMGWETEIISVIHAPTIFVLNVWSIVSNCNWEIYFILQIFFSIPEGETLLSHCEISTWMDEGFNKEIWARRQLPTDAVTNDLAFGGLMSTRTRSRIIPPIFLCQTVRSLLDFSRTRLARP